MNARDRKQRIAAWHADLAAAFAARRCDCGAPAVSIAPGQDELREAGILLRAATPDRCRCLAHATPFILRPRPPRAENGNAGEEWSRRRLREQSDGQDREVPAVDSGPRDARRQRHHTSAVGQGASPLLRAGSRPSEAA